MGLKAPANLGVEYKSDFDAIFPELAAAFGVAYAPDFFAGFEGTAPADLPAHFLPDRLHPNADGVARIVEGLGPSVLELVTPD